MRPLQVELTLRLENLPNMDLDSETDGIIVVSIDDNEAPNGTCTRHV